MSNPPPSDPLRPVPPPPDDAAQVSGQPWSTPSGDPLADGPVQPPRPPQPGRAAAPYPTPPTPNYQPGQASLPPPEAYPPTSQFPAQPGSGASPPPYQPAQPYDPQPYDPAQPYKSAQPYNSAQPYDPAQLYDPAQPYQPGPPPPRRSNAPLIALILAVTVLLCGGAVTAGTLVVNRVADRAKEAVEPITNPTLPTLPTDAPGLPTEIPDLPTDLPSLPTDIPGLPGSGKEITVEYEVTGDGPAEIVWTGKLGESPSRVSNAKLPWKMKVTAKGATLVSVTAVRNSAEGGTISCRATVDGKEVAQSSREGSFATASCLKMVLN